MKRIIDLVKTINRPGVDAVVDYIMNSDFVTARCGKHHTGKGGLVDHSLEVYELMKQEHSDDMPEESIIICSLFHDLGKAKRTGWYFKCKHPARSIAILKRCGFKLTKDEEFAIRNHHDPVDGLLTHKYRNALTKADMTSTCNWKEKNNCMTFNDYLLKLGINLL